MQDQPPAWLQWVPLFLIVIVASTIYRRNRDYKRRNFMLPLDHGQSTSQESGGLPLGVKIFGSLTVISQSLALPSWIRGEYGVDLLAASWSLWTYKLFLSVALLMSGVALLSRFRWARKLTVWVFAIRLMVLLVDLTYFGFTGQFWERPLFNFNPDSTPGTGFLVRTTVIGSIILFHALMIFYFTRRRVRAAFDLPNQALQPTRISSNLGLTPDGWPRG